MSTKREEERNEKIIRGLMKLPPNRRCINCNSVGPQYVCTNFWTFVCLSCSGVHREFTHRVKSVSMSKFTTQEVNSLQQGGNQRAREIYLKNWDMTRMRLPDSSNPDRIRDFIRSVYVNKKYFGERASEKPPTDVESPMGSSADRVRPSSYHSFSQSPPYDYQYEERRYGRPLAAPRRLGSQRAYTAADRFANERDGARLSDFSVSSAGEQLRFERHGPQRTSSSGSFGSFDSTSLPDTTTAQEQQQQAAPQQLTRGGSSQLVVMTSSSAPQLPPLAKPSSPSSFDQQVDLFAGFNERSLVSGPGPAFNAQNQVQGNGPNAVINAPNQVQPSIPGSVINAANQVQPNRAGSVINAPNQVQVNKPGSAITAPSQVQVNKPGSIITAPSQVQVNKPGSVITAPSQVQVNKPGSLTNAPSQVQVNKPGSLTNAPNQPGSAIGAPNQVQVNKPSAAINGPSQVKPSIDLFAGFNSQASDQGWANFDSPQSIKQVQSNPVAVQTGEDLNRPVIPTQEPPVNQTVHTAPSTNQEVSQAWNAFGESNGGVNQPQVVAAPVNQLSALNELQVPVQNTVNHVPVPAKNTVYNAELVARNLTPTNQENLEMWNAFGNSSSTVSQLNALVPVSSETGTAGTQIPVQSVVPTERAPLPDNLFTNHGISQNWSGYEKPSGNVPLNNNINAYGNAVPLNNNVYGNAVPLNNNLYGNILPGNNGPSVPYDQFSKVEASNIEGLYPSMNIINPNIDPASFQSLQGMTAPYQTTKSTNPFDFQDESDIQPNNNMYMDMSSLQAALPAQQAPLDFYAQFYSQNPSSTYAPSIPQGGIYLSGQPPNPQLPNLPPQSTYPSLGGNPFA